MMMKTLFHAVVDSDRNKKAFSPQEQIKAIKLLSPCCSDRQKEKRRGGGNNSALSPPIPPTLAKVKSLAFTPLRRSPTQILLAVD